MLENISYCKNLKKIILRRRIYIFLFAASESNLWFESGTNVVEIDRRACRLRPFTCTLERDGRVLSDSDTTRGCQRTTLDERHIFRDARGHPGAAIRVSELDGVDLLTAVRHVGSTRRIPTIFGNMRSEFYFWGTVLIRNTYRKMKTVHGQKWHETHFESRKKRTVVRGCGGLRPVVLNRG